MNAHVLMRMGTLVEIEFSGTKADQHLDRTVLDHLLKLGEVGVEMQCRLYVKDKHLVIQLDEPNMSEILP